MINVTSGIDLQPLQKELFTRRTRPSYIIMSDKTKKAIENKYPAVYPFGLPENETFAQFMGIPVATCNAVPYGFIDIKD